MAADDGLSGILAELRAGGEVDSQGRFTLDRAQARAKMQKFQLADARRYVLELVQAAVLRGATAITFAIDADDMHMRFDGRPFSAAELDDLWGSMFADGEGRDLRGLRQLALGLNAALGLDPKQIVVCSGDQELRLHPGRDDALTTVAPVAGTTIHVQQRLRLGLVVAFFRNLGGRLGEEVHLRERCCHAPIAITLDGKSIIRGLSLSGAALVEQPLAAPGVQGTIALLGEAQPSHLRLLKDGVWIDSHPLSGCGPGIVAVVDGERLRKDVSLAKIVADEALSEIEGLVRAERWSLLAKLLQQDPQALPRVRAEALKFMKLRDVRKRPDARAIAAAITWNDARACTSPSRPRRVVSLAELVDALGAASRDERAVRCAFNEYTALVADGPPIPRIDPREQNDLARLLGTDVTTVDADLERAHRRELARQAWQLRVMEPALPDLRPALARAQLTGPQIRGELAISPDAVADAPRAAGTIWLIGQGRLLTELSLSWGVPGLDVAVEAPFEPTEFFDDVVRDGTVVEVALRTLAALQTPLAELARTTRGSAIEAGVRGLVKAWLALVLDGEEREGLWQRLGVPRALWPDEAKVLAILPTPRPLRTHDAELAALLQLPLLEDYDGARRSLDEVAQRLARVGKLDFLDRATPPDRGLGQDVLWLGRGDRKIVVGLFGEAALRSWTETRDLRLRERWFWSLPQQTIEDRARALRAEVATTGRDPAQWVRTVELDGAEAVLVLARPGRTRGKAELAAQIDLLVEGRTMTTRSLDLGFRPIFGAATSPELRPAEHFQDVAHGAAMTAVKAALRAGAWALVAAQVRAGESLVGGPKESWLRTQLLVRLSEGWRDELLRHAPEVAAAPLLSTLDRGTLSLTEVDAIVAKHGEIAWVPESTPGAPLRDPPIVRETPAAIAALRGWCGAERVVDGGPRVAEYRRERQFADLPPVTETKLDPGTVWFSVPVVEGAPAAVGEIGLSRRRDDGGLNLMLCAAGRLLGVFTQPDVPAPVDAILADDTVPLDAHGQVDTKSKRYRHILRRCRRSVSGMIATLCERFAGLSEAERAQARVLLLNYAAELLTRESTPSKGLKAVRELPLFIDAWGTRHTLAEIEERTETRGVVDVLLRPVAPPPLDAGRQRLVLVVDEPGRRCLAELRRLNILDERWVDELKLLRALAEAPPCELPDLRQVAWVDRRATIAGGIQAHLWIPRAEDPAPRIRIAEDGREMGFVTTIAGLPCAGIVTGVGGTPGIEIPLDSRQRISLAKQVCQLYQSLAKQVKNGRIGASDRERALKWLGHADAAVQRGADAVLVGLGKSLTQLRAALDDVIPPAMREPKPKPTPPPLDLAELPAPAAPVTPALAPAPAPAPAQPAPPPPTPAQLLLAAVRAELEWARERHGHLLERLRLDRLAIGTGKEPGLARFDGGIVLQQRHPLMTRLLAQLEAGEPPDPIDLAFVVANVYTVMNEVADAIEADDEQAFVAKMAAGLAAGLALR